MSSDTMLMYILFPVMLAAAAHWLGLGTLHAIVFICVGAYLFLLIPRLVMALREKCKGS